MLPNKNLHFIGIENTSFCGAKCIMCPRDKINYLKSQMPMDLFRKAVDEAVAMGATELSISGLGEPLMDKYLEERLKFVKEKYPFIEIGLTTTGHLLDDNMSDLICKYVKSIKISNYGFSKETYEKVHRGSLKYEQIVKNIEKYLQRSDRPYTIMTFLILPENKNEMEAWKMYYEPKTDRIDIWLPHNWGGFFPLSYSQGQDAEDRIKPCQRVINMDGLVIRTDGRVNVCWFNVHSDKLIIGDINIEALSTIVNNEKINELQRIHSERTVMSTDLPCKNCDQIRDRNFALVYTSDSRRMKVGKRSLHT